MAMTSPNPFPMQERPLTLPSGREITVLNLAVNIMRGRPGGTFVIQYRTSTPAAEALARESEATEIVTMHRSFADEKGLDEMRVEICNTQAAAAMREPAETRYSFGRSATGDWTLRDVT
jgi:hypothetical protein